MNEKPLSLSPMDEIELSNVHVDEAEIDEIKRCKPTKHTPADPDEPACDCFGKPVDMQRDTENVDLPNLMLDDAADILGPL